MQILLISIDAKFIHSNPAIYDLQAYARAYGGFRDEIGRAEFTINQSRDYILGKLYEAQADIYCFSCYIWNISLIKALTDSLKKVRPECEIWWGGPEVSFNAVQLLSENPALSGIMRGEGEETFLELCRHYLTAAPEDGAQGSCDQMPEDGAQGSGEEAPALSGIRGITFRKGQEAVENPPRDPIDLSTLPFCYEALDDLQLKNRIIYYETSRGCPFGCSYCLSSIDRRVRFRSLPVVYRELDFFIEHEVAQVKFVDRTFNCNHEHTMAIWRYLIAHDREITNFHFEIAVELLNEEEIELLSTMRPGLVQLEIGVQTTNEATLKEIHRPADMEHLRALVARLHAPRNIHLHLDLIAGLPFEDLARFRQSFDEVFAMAPDQLQMGFLKVLKGSYMYEHRDEYDCAYDAQAPFEVLCTKWLSYGDVLELKLVEEMVELYYNSGQFVHSLPYVMAMYGSAYDFFLQLGTFYRNEGYDYLASSRMQRYEILRSFAKMLPIDKKHLDECLVTDLYLRENLKKRAAWMCDLKGCKRELRALEDALQIREDAFCHIEPFAEHFAVFDYRKRDRLDHNATLTYYPRTAER
ncbi:MAG: DUF4080 domain-containing protein [Lachnospiraceae bacterium]|nr:DUF4080 domain-containing protein [Lachnospiraceae bacterium]